MSVDKVNISNFFYALFGITAIASLYNMPIFITMLIVFIAGLYSIHRFYKIYSVVREKRSFLNSENFCRFEHRELEKWVLENHKGHESVVKDFFRLLIQKRKLFNGDRPLVSAMFSGPTGTGKTYLAELISETIYKNKKPFDINMGRFKSPTDGEKLCEMIINHAAINSPCLFILNEIDKCHPEVLHSLYSMFDTGLLYHSKKHTKFDLSYCSFIATSNYGVSDLNNLISRYGRLPSRGDILDVLSNEGKFEKPLVARFDAQYILPSLQNISLAEVVLIECCKYWQTYGIEVEYLGAELILKIITKNDKYEEYGVRELERIVKETMDPVVLSAIRKSAKRIKLYADKRGKIKAKTFLGRSNAA